MKPNQFGNAQSGLVTEVVQLAYVLLSAVALCMCVYCLGQGKDLFAAYWAFVTLVAPRIEGSFRESE
jgi:hypothetical protein